MSGTKQSIVEQLVKWPNMLEHIADLNGEGYMDCFIPRLRVACGKPIDYTHGKPVKYIVIAVTDGSGICISACDTKEEAIKCIT